MNSIHFLALPIFVLDIYGFVYNIYKEEPENVVWIEIFFELLTLTYTVALQVGGF